MSDYVRYCLKELRSLERIIEYHKDSMYETLLYGIFDDRDALLAEIREYRGL